MKEITSQQLCVLICYAYEEISIGKARELLGWRDAEIREQAETRCRSAQDVKNTFWSLEQENERLSKHIEFLEEGFVNEACATLRDHFIKKKQP